MFQRVLWVGQVYAHAITGDYEYFSLTEMSDQYQAKLINCVKGMEKAQYPHYMYKNYWLSTCVLDLEDTFGSLPSETVRIYPARFFTFDK